MTHFYILDFERKRKMKKSNLATFLFLCFIMVGILLYMFLERKTPEVSDTEMSSSSIIQNDMLLPPQETLETENTTEADSQFEVCTGITETIEVETEIIETEAEITEPITKEPISMEDALFIGDSRTVGLMEYAGITGADYFCTVGMSVYNLHEKPVSVPNVGKVTLTELLNHKKYKKIYIMLGINEAGYQLSSIIEKYSELLEFIKSRQSEAVIFIQANLHVTTSRSNKDKVINNTTINALNTELAKFADGKTKFYLDANTLFDDKTGGLSAEKSEDSTHLYAKYYQEWGKWIIKQTALLLQEG